MKIPDEASKVSEIQESSIMLLKIIKKISPLLLGQIWLEVKRQAQNDFFIMPY